MLHHTYNIGSAVGLVRDALKVEELAQRYLEADSHIASKARGASRPLLSYVGTRNSEIGLHISMVSQRQSITLHLFLITDARAYALLIRQPLV